MNFADTSEPAKVVDTVLPPIRKRVDVTTSSRQQIKGLLDGLVLNDARFNYDRVSMMLQNQHPELVKLFDDIHMFSNLVAGNLHKKTDVFWNSTFPKGRQHLIKMVADAAVQELDSIKLKDVPNLPILKDDLVEFLETHPAVKQEARSSTGQEIVNWKPSIVDFIRKHNKENKNVKLEIPHKHQSGDWFTLETPDLVADAAWQRIHVKDLKHKILRIPTALSLEKWIEKIAAERNVEHVRGILSRTGMDNLRRVEQAVAQAVTADFYGAFINGMYYAQQKYPGVNMLSPDFHRLMNDITFVRLVSGIYISAQNVSSTFASEKGKVGTLFRQSVLISEFLDDPTYNAFAPSFSSSFPNYPVADFIDSVL